MSLSPAINLNQKGDLSVPLTGDKDKKKK